MTTAFLRLEGLDKSFGDLRVLSAIDLEVAEGEVLALLGPSGSGKTTALRLLAGFETPQAGRILVGGEDITALSPERRGFGMVFQHYALFPHLTVGQNVAFGLETQGWERSLIPGRVAEMLELVDLAGFEGRRLDQVSGGQQQRVALARALAPKPRLLLLDEPLSNLDPALRERTRRELRRTVEAIGITTVLVTHEQEEAFHLGDRVAVLHRGRLEQVGTPEELYQRPTSRFVATFVGRATGLPGRFEPAADGGASVRLDGFGEVPPWSGEPAAPGWQPDSSSAGLAVELVVRPESLRMVVGPGAEGGLPGRVVARRYAGAATFYLVELEAGDGGDPREVEVMAPPDAARIGDRAALLPSAEGPRPRIFRTGAGASG